MEGWIIDFQSDRGPDYTFRNIMVIVDEDEDSAKRIFLVLMESLFNGMSSFVFSINSFLDNYDYEGGEDYLSLGFNEMLETIIDNDREGYMT